MLFPSHFSAGTNLPSVNSTPDVKPPSAKVSVSVEMRIKGLTPAPTYSFLSRLNLFAAALISHYTNLRALHARRCFHTLRDGNPALSIRVPYIIFRLSELIPSKNKSSRTGKAWANDSVKLTFQGLEPLPRKEILPPPNPSPNVQTQILNTPAARTQPANATGVPTQLGQDEGVVIVTEARMIVPVPKALTILKERVDRDIAFDAKTGSFAFRLRSKVGETVIPAFVERAIRVERLVDFIEVLHKHEKLLTCEYISLGRIIFTYRSTYSSASPDTIPIVCPESYKAIVDFGVTDSLMTLIFEQGNPHLRIADNLTQVLNGSQGLDGVATLLPLTLPALRAFDALEGAWAPLSIKGEAFVLVRAVEWFIVRYNLFLSGSSMTRTIIFEIKLQQRKGEPWWYVRRIDTREKDGDEIDVALKPLWNSNGQGWRGMRANAVAQPSGVEELLGKLDDIMRTVTSAAPGREVVSAAPVPTQARPTARAPEAPMKMQQHRQQQTPGQSQSQDSERGNPLKREIVEID